MAYPTWCYFFLNLTDSLKTLHRRIFNIQNGESNMGLNVSQNIVQHAGSAIINSENPTSDSFLDHT